MKVLGALLIAVGFMLVFVSWSLGALAWPPIGFEWAIVLTMPARFAGVASIGLGALVAVLGMSAPARTDKDEHTSKHRGDPD